ncbi:hypothetical protein [uncultured Propionibacterium sp.]|uniref:hypothetical protein n=1 Tax=uncultured Propionibacterium sp. TaxID=218066 RepID=UPI00292D2E82|nr:hypothetical protein [uncultured Propionibacterium sp.]
MPASLVAPRTGQPLGGRLRRALLLVPCGLSMLMGLDSALALLNLSAPLGGERFTGAHGMLMVIGFVGALVGLERSVAIRRWWACVAPVCMALGALLSLVGPLPMRVGKAVMVAGCIAMCVDCVVLWNRNREPLVAVQIGGGVSALCSAIVWFGGAAVPGFISFLISFLVLTVIAERLGPSRIGQLAWTPGRRRLHEDSLVVLAALALLSGPLTMMRPSVALPVYGLVLIALSVQSASGDVARRGIKAAGSNRFMPVMILTGYGWLVVTGLLLLRPALSGLRYDATLHAVLLGFTMSMVAAHAPTILPALLGVQMRFVAGFWGVGLVLHATLAVRVAADLAGSEFWRQVGGLGNIASLLGLVAVAIWSSVTQDAAATEQAPRPGSGGPPVVTVPRADA